MNSITDASAQAQDPAVLDPATNGAHPDAAIYRSTLVPSGTLETGAPCKLTYRHDLAEVLPAELIARPQFVVWNYERIKSKDGKPERLTKVPYSVVYSGKASSTNSDTWSTFDRVMDKKGCYSGIGFMLAADDGIVGIDLDHCRNPDTGDLSDTAKDAIERFGSYSEVSPSGEGIRIFVKGVLPEGRRKETARGIEMYEKSRFLTITGNAIGESNELKDCTDELVKWHAEIFPTKPKTTATPAPISLSMNDEQIIEKARQAKNSAKFVALFDQGGGNHGSGSEADLALLGHLKFWTQDAAQLERLWRASSVWRDEKSGKRLDYVQRTIARALENVTEKFDPARRIVSMMNGVAPKRQATAADDDFVTEAEIETPPATAGEVLPPADRELVLHCLDCEEAGDSELFAHLYSGRRVLFDHSEKQWYMWHGHYYRADKIGIIRRLVIAQLATQYLHHAADLTREAEAEGEAGAHKRLQADKLVKRARQLRKLQRIENILKLSQSWLGIEGGDWDTHADLLAVQNGVLELETGTLRAGKTSDLIRTVAPTKWRGLHEPAPRWEQFTLEIFGGEIDLANFLQRLLGIGLIGAVKEHRLPILYGEGRNGKDTLLETISAVLGSCAGAVSPDVLVADKKPRGGAATPHLCDLQGRRIAWVSETDEAARLSVAQAKYLTGGGSISARPLYGRQFEFSPSHLLLLITNHKPHAPADEYALWKRLLLVPFTQNFVDAPAAANEHRCDIHLKEKLEAEAAGILAWLVRGYIEWKRNGLNPPETVKAATEEYRRKEDVLQEFINDCCIEDDDALTSAQELFNVYQRWAGKGAMWRNTFGEKMAARFTKTKRKSGNFYEGIEVLVESVESVESQSHKVPLRKPHVKKALQKDSTDSTDSTNSQNCDFEEVEL
jgi:putative DNA primase/helicase